MCSSRPLAGVDEREAEVETAVGERQPVEPEAQLALARAAVPAERAGVLLDGPEHEAAVVAQLDRHARRRDARVGGDDEAHGRRLAGRELDALVAVVVEQLGAHDPRLAAPPLAQAGLELVGIRVRCEQPAVGGDRLARLAVERDLALAQQHRAIAEALDGLRVVRDEEDRPAAVLELGDLAEALALELLVADGEHLVEQEHVRLDVRGDGEAEPHEHPRRVRPHRQVDELLELRERDDLVHQLAHACAREAVDRAVQVDVLAAGEVGVEAGAELEQRRDAAARLDAPAGRLDDPRDEAQQRRLAGAVAADEADGVARLGRERDVAQRLHVARTAPAARDEEVLERALRLRVDAEGPRDAVDDDPAGRHVAAADKLPRTMSASVRTKRGSSFGISIRSSSSPSSRALSCASLSMSQRISR